MTTLGTIVVAWAAVHLYLAFTYGLVYVRRKEDPEFRHFAVLSIALAIYAVGAAILANATDHAQAVLGVRVKLAAACVAAPGFVAFAFAIVRKPASAVLSSAYMVGLIGLALNALGVLVDTETVVPAPELTLIDARWCGVKTSDFLGPLLVTAVIGFVLYAFTILVREGEREREQRFVVGAAAIAFVALAHDIAMHVVPFRSLHFVEHAALPTNLAAGYLLLRRFLRAEDELRHRTVELRKSAEDLREVQHELVKTEQLAAVGELSAVIATEIRTPLVALQDAVRHLTETETADSKTLEMVDREGDRLNRLVRHLLTYARPVEPNRGQFDLTELVNTAVGQAMAAGNGIVCDMRLAEGPAPILADSDLLRRVFQNIVENALQAMPLGGVLTVRSRSQAGPDGPVWEVSFHDTGIGMDTLVRNRARDPFFSTRQGGTGLGLAVVDRVVRAHGGTLTIKSVRRSGTTVTVTIPAVPPAKPPPPDRPRTLV